LPTTSIKDKQIHFRRQNQDPNTPYFENGRPITLKEYATALLQEQKGATT
jgi:hypothetical protein